MSRLWHTELWCNRHLQITKQFMIFENLFFVGGAFDAVVDGKAQTRVRNG